MSTENTIYFYNSLINSDTRGIAKIYELMFPKVSSYIQKRDGTAGDAEDVFQQALIQLTVRLKTASNTFEFTSSFEAYLFTVCKNLWRRELTLKNKWVTNTEVYNLKDESADIALAIIDQKRWDLYEEKFEKLSENCQEILKLFFQKLSYAEIIEKLSYANESVARQRVFKCRTKLSQLIKKDTRFSKLATYDS